MHVTGSSYAWLIFNLNTKSRYSQIIYGSVYTWDMARVNPAPCFLLPALFTCHPLFLLPAFLLTWRTSFLSRGANTHPLLSLVCYQLPTLCYFSHHHTPHRSSYNIYIVNINNISRPRLIQEQYKIFNGKENKPWEGKNKSRAEKTEENNTKPVMQKTNK
jgi:hypothetical protein